MSVLFNHARRYDLFDGNPINLVGQSAKRQRTPEVLGVSIPTWPRLFAVGGVGPAFEDTMGISLAPIRGAASPIGGSR